MNKTNIEWATMVWNPTTGCNKVSAGCKNCYAEVMHNRLIGMKAKKYTQPFLDGAVTHYESLRDPLTWKKPQRVFVNSMSDLFHKDVPFQFIIDVFEVMSNTPQHTYMILTKRADRMQSFMTECTYNPYGYPFESLPNVWLGVSVENQEAADERIPLLLQTPAAIKFLSCEPLLGPVDIPIRWFFPIRKDFEDPSVAVMDVKHAFETNLLEPLPGIHWVIAGGESGHKARPMHPDWARSLRDQCAAAGVPFFFKQWGEFKPDPGENGVMVRVGKHASGNMLDGKQHLAFPETLTEMAI